MSPLSPKQALLDRKARKRIIREHILTSTYHQLATMCGVTKRTIIRDVDRWRTEGGFEQFLIDEFFASYPNIKEDFPEKAFDRLCYLLGKHITRKVEKHEQIDIREIKLSWTKDERSHSQDQVSTA